MRVVLSLSIILSSSIFYIVNAQMEDTNIKKALVISGGGTRGSWAAGFSKGLAEAGNKYQVVGGTSAGALIMSSVILEQFGELDSLFNSISNKDVYNVNPIRRNGNIKIGKSILRTILGHPSIGETKNLRKLIEKIFTQKDYENIIKQKKEVFCITTSLNSSKISLKSSRSSSYEDLLDWIWASASVPVLMSPVKKDGESWVDGGLLDNVPIDGALLEGVKDIDVIALFTEKPAIWESSEKLVDISGRTLNILINSTFRDNITIGKLLSELEGGIKLNIYYMPIEDAQFLSNLYSFNSETLSEGYRKGYDAFKNKTIQKRTFMMNSNHEFREID